ncbi:MAG: aminoglycoside phosphotransferase family protein [Oscillospiraceae bacterium]|nr:aminoglycoside phosphotransferase family protein [Oscillospiraceae bacterium]
MTDIPATPPSPKLSRCTCKIHTIPLAKTTQNWATWFGERIDGYLAAYQNHDLQFEGDSVLIAYLENNRKLLATRPECLHHGDYNPSNLIMTPGGEIGVIDFNYFGRNGGDPVWEFCIVPWGEEPQAFFLSGLLNGYYGKEPPAEEFAALAYYLRAKPFMALAIRWASKQEYLWRKIAENTRQIFCAGMTTFGVLSLPGICRVQTLADPPM